MLDVTHMKNISQSYTVVLMSVFSVMKYTTSHYIHINEVTAILPFPKKKLHYPIYDTAQP